MNIHEKFIGGNIKITKICGSDIYLENQIRDSSEDWFYWAFCIEGAEGKKLNFHMQSNRLGYWGPAVSYDLINWHWLDNVKEDSFRYEFNERENKVYFAHHMLYHPDRFNKIAEILSLDIFELCKSRKGRSVPACIIGKGSKSVILTARHHACESTGSFVLEGVLKELVLNPIDDVKIFCVPFVDYDGVVDGDQGKARKPHDHNRDYMPDKSIYPETSAIKEYVNKFGCNYGFDFHSPWHKGGENDNVFIVRNNVEKLNKTEKFANILEKHISKTSMKYSSKNDHAPMTGWNQPSPNFGFTMNQRLECEIAHSFETAYFGTENNKISDEKMVELGKCYARALKEYIKEIS
jgi:hypothetical protein